MWINEQLNITTLCIALTEVVQKIKQQFNFRIQIDARKRKKETNYTNKGKSKTNLSTEEKICMKWPLSWKLMIWMMTSWHFTNFCIFLKASHDLTLKKPEVVKKPTGTPLSKPSDNVKYLQIKKLYNIQHINIFKKVFFHLNHSLRQDSNLTEN